jgi:ArsR family transcriptional regulator, arsenate/arsenite/antimonite-responsive transcriptional repressor
MDKHSAILIFESLASSARLDIFRLLVKHTPNGLVAGEIAAQLNIPATNLSFHLKGMTHAGLINLTQEGRYYRYRANTSQIQAIIGYLTEECCSGNPDRCFNTETSCCD